MAELNLWRVSGLENEVVIQEKDATLLCTVDSTGMIYQEDYDKIVRNGAEWHVFLVQRGKDFKRYTASSYEMAQAAACILYAKHFMYLGPFSWEGIDRMVEELGVMKAAEWIRQELLPPADDEGMPDSIALEWNGSRYEVIYRCMDQAKRLSVCDTDRQAVFVYRNRCLALQRFRRIYGRIARALPAIREEYARLAMMYFL